VSVFRFICALVLISISSSEAAPLSQLEQRGKQLYFTGTDDGGSVPPQAFLGAESTPVPARLVPCASCHGDDGRGRPEGNIAPPDITWSRLITAQDLAYANGGAHPGFSEDTLSQAVTRGVDPAGSSLDPIMPRYSFTHEKLSALASYLKVIANDQAPGVTENVIPIAVIAPTALVAEVRELFSALMSELNEHGGIFGRKLEMRTLDDTDAYQQLKALIDSRAIFAAIISDGVEGGPELLRLAEETRTPMLSAENFALPPAANRRYGFSIFPDVRAQMRMLVDYVEQHTGGSPPHTALIAPERVGSDVNRELIALVSDRQQASKAVERRYQEAAFDARALVADLSAQEVDTVFFAGGGGALASLLDAAVDRRWRPRLVISGATMTESLLDAPEDMASNIYLAFPMLADTAHNHHAVRALRAKYNLNNRRLAAQLLAHCAVQIFARGLATAGRDISQGRFVAALESLRDFDVGLGRPINFTSAKHVGVSGAYVLGVDPNKRRFRVLSEWTAIESSHAPK
jgi:ABC-type branched-subunit amino acid transport system substrate-binding protein